MPLAVEVFLVAFAGTLALALAAESRRARSVGVRIDEIRSAREPLRTAALLAPPPGGEAERAPRAAGFKAAATLLLGGLQKVLVRRGRTRRVESRLRQAGIRLRAAEFLALRVLGGLVLGLAAALVSGGWWLFLAAGAAGFLLPDLYVERRLLQRRRDFVEQIPDALGAIGNSLRSGFSFLQAVEVAAQELPDPAAGELLQVVRETQVDIPVEDALANLYERMPLPEVQLVVTAVIIQRQVGGNLAGLLEQVGDTVRMRLHVERELRALTAQGRLSGWIVGLLPVGLGGIISLFNGGYLSPLFSDVLGQVLLAAVAVMQVIGMVVIRRLVRLEV